MIKGTQLNQNHEDKDLDTLGRENKMKLTTKKIESLIQEMIEDGYSREQKRKILALIRKTRHLLLELQVVQGFFPTIINGIYYYDKDVDIDKAIRKSVRVPHAKKAITNHYRAMLRIIEILEEVNQYLFLLETLEIQGNIAFIAKGMIYGGLSGPTTDGGHIVKLEELASMVDSGVTFLEDVEKAAPGLLGKGNLALNAIRDGVESFNINYSELKDYLDSVVWN